jgi:hypothetical protein
LRTFPCQNPNDPRSKRILREEEEEEKNKEQEEERRKAGRQADRQAKLAISLTDEIASIRELMILLVLWDSGSDDHEHNEEEERGTPCCYSLPSRIQRHLLSVCLSVSLACSAPCQGPQTLAAELLPRVAKTVENLEEVMLLRTLQCR